jgi:hypothetical protein
MNLEERFKYHPLTTTERIAKHKAVNESALQFAKIIRSVIKDDFQFECILDSIQTARMKANQIITLEELDLI